MVTLICANCEKSFDVHKYRKGKAKYCSYKCYWEAKKKYYVGSNASNCKGGKTQSSSVYILIHKPNHPVTTNRYVLRSHLIMEKTIGRYITTREVVHHKGIKYPINSIKNKQDDRIKNLQLFNNKKEHTQFHCNIKNKK